jgi:hypothetical protein
MDFQTSSYVAAKMQRASVGIMFEWRRLVIHSQRRGFLQTNNSHFNVALAVQQNLDILTGLKYRRHF